MLDSSLFGINLNNKKLMLERIVNLVKISSADTCYTYLKPPHPILASAYPCWGSSEYQFICSLSQNHGKGSKFRWWLGDSIGKVVNYLLIVIGPNLYWAGFTGFDPMGSLMWQGLSSIYCVSVVFFFPMKNLYVRINYLLHDNCISAYHEPAIYGNFPLPPLSCLGFFLPFFLPQIWA